MSNPKETYLGDGLYVSLDNGMIKLRTPRGEGDHWVALEPEVLIAFLNWLTMMDIVRKDRS